MMHHFPLLYTSCRKQVPQTAQITLFTVGAHFIQLAHVNRKHPDSTGVYAGVYTGVYTGVNSQQVPTFT